MSNSLLRKHPLPHPRTTSAVEINTWLMPNYPRICRLRPPGGPPASGLSPAGPQGPPLPLQRIPKGNPKQRQRSDSYSLAFRPVTLPAKRPYIIGEAKSSSQEQVVPGLTRTSLAFQVQMDLSQNIPLMAYHDSGSLAAGTTHGCKSNISHR